MPTAKEWLLAHVRGDHERLLRRLRSLDRCLDSILYHGEVRSELRGFGGLRIRCLELQGTLKAHIPEEEQMFARLEGRDDLRPLLGRLQEEHRTMTRVLDETVTTLDTIIMSGRSALEDLLTLRDKLRALSSALQDHISTENRLVLPLLAA